MAKPVWPNIQYIMREFLSECVSVCVEQCLREADGVIWFLGIGFGEQPLWDMEVFCSMSEQSAVRNVFTLTRGLHCEKWLVVSEVINVVNPVLSVLPHCCTPNLL